MKQLIRHRTQPIQARIIIPGSKSITNRALLLAALANGVSEVSGILVSDDTLAFAQALHELGVSLRLDQAKSVCVITGNSGRFSSKSTMIWCAESGITARFLLAVCAATPGVYHFDGKEVLRNRPIATLLQVLRRQGVETDPPDAKQMPLTLTGVDGLAGGEIEIDGSESGQFISALLMAAPMARVTMEVTAKDLVSSPFVEMTCAMMAEFGVLVRRLPQGRFIVPVPQQYQATNYQVEPDLSTASYFFAAAAVTAGQVTIQPVDLTTSKQGDANFLKILAKMGCEIISTTTGLTVKGSAELHGVNVDMRDYSDTFMTLAAIAPFAKSPTTITNIAHTRRQESDRISAMRSGLEKLGVKVEEGADWIRIHPSAPIAGTIDSHHDHRIAMAFSIIGLRVPGIVINNSECVSKTCPQFFQLWESL